MGLHARARASLITLVILAALVQPALAAGAESSESEKVAEATNSVATPAPESVAASGEDIASEAAQASTRSSPSDSSGSRVAGAASDEEVDEPASAGSLEQPDAEVVTRAVDETVRETSAQTTAVAEETVAHVSTTATQSATRVRAKAQRMVDRSEEVVEGTVDRAETTLGAPAKPVIDKARAIAGRGSNPPRSSSDSPADRPATGGPSEAGLEAPLAPGGEPTRREHGPSPADSVGGRIDPLFDTPTSPGASLLSRTPLSVPGVFRLENGPRAAAVRQGSSPLSALGSPEASNPAPVTSPDSPGSPEPLVSASPSGGISSTSISSAGAAILLAALSLATASPVGLLRLRPALVRPVAFVSLLERPG
jgi:hypothetical protein